jgi:hypothetical protein
MYPDSFQLGSLLASLPAIRGQPLNPAAPLPNQVEFVGDEPDYTGAGIPPSSMGRWGRPGATASTKTFQDWDCRHLNTKDVQHSRPVLIVKTSGKAVEHPRTDTADGMKGLRKTERKF